MGQESSSKEAQLSANSLQSSYNHIKSMLRSLFLFVKPQRSTLLILKYNISSFILLLFIYLLQNRLLPHQYLFYNLQLYFCKVLTFLLRIFMTLV